MATIVTASKFRISGLLAALPETDVTVPLRRGPRPPPPPPRLPGAAPRDPQDVPQARRRPPPPAATRVSAISTSHRERTHVYWTQPASPAFTHTFHGRSPMSTQIKSVQPETVVGRLPMHGPWRSATGFARLHYIWMPISARATSCILTPPPPLPPLPPPPSSPTSAPPPHSRYTSSPRAALRWS